MRTRTRLTTPPGQEPVAEPDGRGPDHETYTRGLALPTEPRVPSRARRPVRVLLALVLLGALAYGGFRLATSGQYEDPALTDVPARDSSG